MDLIASVIAAALGFVVSIFCNVIAHDICVSADRTCTKIIRRAGGRLAPFDRELRESEWLADLYDRETVREKYQHAIGCFLVAGKMRREATTFMLVVSFDVGGIGNVPLTLKLNSKVLWPLFLKAAAAKSKMISRNAIILGTLYSRLKINRSAKASLGSDFKKITMGQCKVSAASLRFGRLDVDVRTIYRIFRFFMELPPEAKKLLADIQSVAKLQSAPPAKA
jgi:hypothetical protein